MPSIAHLVHEYGLIVVASVIALESIGLPVPGESVLIIAGAWSLVRESVDVLLEAARPQLRLDPG